MQFYCLSWGAFELVDFCSCSYDMSVLLRTTSAFNMLNIVTRFLELSFDFKRSLRGFKYAMMNGHTNFVRTHTCIYTLIYITCAYTQSHNLIGIDAQANMHKEG